MHPLLKEAPTNNAANFSSLLRGRIDSSFWLAYHKDKRIVKTENKKLRKKYTYQSNGFESLR